MTEKLLPGIDIPEEFNIASHLIDRHIKEGRGKKIAVYFEDRAMTYQDIYELTNKTGNAIKSLGVRREERVMLLLPDCPEFIASFLGAIKIGAIPVPINTVMTPKDYEYYLNDSRAQALVVSDDLLPKIEEIKKKNLKYLKHVIVVGKSSGGVLSYQDLIESASSKLKAEETNKDDAAFWLYSSGTTGKPKGVVHLQHDVVYCAELYGRQVMEMKEDDRIFSVSRLFFAAGLGAAFTFPFCIGASTILCPQRPLPENVFEIIHKYKPSILFGVPTSYNAMLQIGGAEKKYNLDSLRTCLSAGEALPSTIFLLWKKKFGIEILDGIGSTEVLHIFCSNRSGQVQPGSSGKSVPGYELKIVDDEGRKVSQGEIGLLMVKGESTFAYYWNKHQKTKETIIGEWVNTGDRYYQDSEGYYWYMGRGDDMLKVGGIWVSPTEIENTMYEHPAVLEAAVVGTEDRDHLVKPEAFIVLRSEYSASNELATEIQNFVKSEIAPYKYPRWIRFVPELPKTATGKIQRFKLRRDMSSKT